MSRAAEAAERAAQWIIAQEDSDWSDTNQTALEEWLAESDGNRTAYLRLRHTWREADRMVVLGHSTESSAELPSFRVPFLARQWWLPASIAASLILAVGIGWNSWQHSSQPIQVAATEQFETAVGGHRTVALSDGSKVELNTASRMRAAVTGKRREIWLDEGEAFFEVRHLDGLPFVVHAGSRQVTVLGTKFSVRRIGNEVTVSVLEGRVRVDEVDGSRAIRSTTITGGDIALANGPATLVTSRSAERVESALSWREGMLSFDQDRLYDVVAEFNRYNRKLMVVTDREAGSIRIGGMFPSSDPDAFARLLRDAYGLKVEETRAAIKISS